MAFQQIQEQLDKTHTWYIILTGPCAELRTKARLEDIGMIAYLPLASVKRQWGGKTKKVRIPAIARCVFIYASDEELQILQNGFLVIHVKELLNAHQNQ